MASQVKRALIELIQTDILREVEQLAESLPDELNNWSDAESAVRSGMLKIAGCLLQGWVDNAERRVEPPRCLKCDRKMRHRGLKSCSITTTLGVMRLRRPRYRCNECGRELYPHDASARFLSHRVSLNLARVIARIAADRPFGQATEDLKEDYLVRVGKQLVEQVTENAGRKILEVEDAAREAVRSASPEEGVELLPTSHHAPCEVAVACCDGTMLHTQSAPTYLSAKKNKGASDWREVRVGNISVGAPLLKLKEERSRDAPERGHGFQMDVQRSSTFARFESVADVGWDLYLRAIKAGYFDASLQCFVSDGAAWLRNLASAFFPNAVQILDWYHVMERIGDLAATLFGAESKVAKAWTKRRETELWNGRRDAVIRAIRRQYAKSNWPKKERQEIEETLTYLLNNRDRMKYPRYRELGLPIGSGRVEGLCRTLVKDRCKKSGMRNWTPTGAEGVLRIRAAKHDRTFNETWRLHFAV